MYLTIKDDQTRIQAVMFASDNRYLKFRPEDGMHVLIKGEVGVFEPYGQYQLYIRHMEPDGIGSLYLAFEQLKEKLQEQGYFDKSHKKRSEEHTSELQSRFDLVCRLLLEKKNLIERHALENQGDRVR